MILQVTEKLLEQPVFAEKQPGTYVLEMYLPDTLVLQVGKLASIKFQSGFYTYVGSAHGNGGLAARLTRHLKLQKKCRWHIDYLTCCTPVREIWYATYPGRLECQWATRLSNLATAVIQNFGSSDCHCDAHLFHFQQMPDIEQFIAGSRTAKISSPEIRVWPNPAYHEQLKIIVPANSPN